MGKYLFTPPYFSLFQSQASLLEVKTDLQPIGDFIVPFATKNITYRRRSFDVAGPSLWYSLSLEIRSFRSRPMFRFGLDTFLFREAYNIPAP